MGSPTLIAFSRYTLAFGARCFFIALAASFAGGASGIAEERVINVITGGLFGLIAGALTERWLVKPSRRLPAPRTWTEGRRG